MSQLRVHRSDQEWRLFIHEYRTSGMPNNVWCEALNKALFIMQLPGFAKRQ